MVDVSIIHRIYMDCRLVTLGSVFLTYDAGPTLGMCGFRPCAAGQCL